MPNRRQLLQHFAAASAWWATQRTVSTARGADSPPKIKIGQIGVGHAHASKLGVYRAIARLRSSRHRRAGRGAARAKAETQTRSIAACRG